MFVSLASVFIREGNYFLFYSNFFLITSCLSKAYIQILIISILTTLIYCIPNIGIINMQIICIYMLKGI